MEHAMSSPFIDTLFLQPFEKFMFSLNAAKSFHNSSTCITNKMLFFGVGSLVAVCLFLLGVSAIWTTLFDSFVFDFIQCFFSFAFERKELL